jgi:hypothetical protein
MISINIKLILYLSWIACMMLIMRRITKLLLIVALISKLMDWISITLLTLWPNKMSILRLLNSIIKIKYQLSHLLDSILLIFKSLEINLLNSNKHLTFTKDKILILKNSKKSWRNLTLMILLLNHPEGHKYSITSLIKKEILMYKNYLGLLQHKNIKGLKNQEISLK